MNRIIEKLRAPMAGHSTEHWRPPSVGRWRGTGQSGSPSPLESPRSAVLLRIILTYLSVLCYLYCVTRGRNGPVRPAHCSLRCHKHCGILTSVHSLSHHCVAHDVGPRRGPARVFGHRLARLSATSLKKRATAGAVGGGTGD